MNLIKYYLFISCFLIFASCKENSVGIDPAPEQTDYKILFTAFESSAYGLFVVESSGNNLKKIRDFQEYIGAAWTPDGSRIIYLKGGGSSRQLFIMDSSGINEQKIADSVETFAVSPDGNRLCYIYYNGYWEVFLCNIDGSNKTKLTNTQMQKFGLHWSPVNPEIVFTENDNVLGSYENIYRMQVNSGILDTLATGYEIPQVCDWSKDGNFILFGTVYSDLYKINLMTKQITELAYSQSASFSPDGQKILFQSSSQVYMMNADGSNQHKVSKYPNTCMYPEWSPEGTSISYITANDTLSKIVIADLNGNNERLLVPNSSSYQYYYNWDPVK
ncbi:MAG TPA: hypothetical protein VLM39_05890 [Ignavibacteriaceae bacterium]|nr:hypothetical protein [Ignavibacteriaceae bacterium]